MQERTTSSHEYDLIQIKHQAKINNLDLKSVEIFLRANQANPRLDLKPNNWMVIIGFFFKMIQKY